MSALRPGMQGPTQPLVAGEDLVEETGALQTEH